MIRRSAAWDPCQLHLQLIPCSELFEAIGDAKHSHDARCAAKGGISTRLQLCEFTDATPDCSRASTSPQACKLLVQLCCRKHAGTSALATCGISSGATFFQAKPPLADRNRFVWPDCDPFGLDNVCWTLWFGRVADLTVQMNAVEG